MGYRKDSHWNDKVELACLIIFKKAKSNEFLSCLISMFIDEFIANADYDLPPKSSLKAKVGNIKSIAGINKPSRASSDTKKIYNKYHQYDIADLEKIYSKAKREDTLA